jgi:hypothetical protein
MKVFNRLGRRRRAVERKRAVELGLERFEDRLLLATFTVQTTADFADNGQPATGSLREAILLLDQNGSATNQNTINFNIPIANNNFDPATGTFTITLTTTGLAPITKPVLIDGLSEAPFLGRLASIRIDGGNLSGGVLTLGAGSGGATPGAGSQIQALEIEHSGGDGILIQSPNNTIGGLTAGTGNTIGLNTGAGVSISGAAATSNVVEGNFIGTDAGGASLGNTTGIAITSGTNTIGGTVSGAANTIAHNTGDAVHVVSGSGNAIRENLIFSNGAAIGVDSGANSDQQAPAGLIVTSVPNLTTIDYQIITSTAGAGDYTADFYASDASGHVGPASQFLGSVTEKNVPAGTQSFTGTLSLAAPLGSNQKLSATVTGPDNSTSPFAATAVTASPPFVVTNTFDNSPGHAVGSLRQVILNANNSPPATGTDDITFAIPGQAPFVITVTSVLPTIAVPVTIDATTQNGFNPQHLPIVEINGNAQSFDGLILGATSSNATVASTIRGLDITNFTGAGIHVASRGSKGALIAGNFLGADISGTIANPSNQVGVLVDDAPNVTIGGTTAADQNTIGFNTTAGVQILGTSTSDNTNALIEGNFIGTNSASQDHGNAAAVQVFNASGNTIGGTALMNNVPVAGNTIGFSAQNGVAILSGSNNVVRENTYIGPDGSGTPASVNDIALGPNANNGLLAPQIISSQVTGNKLTLKFTVAVPNGTSVDVDVYQDDSTSSPVRRRFLGTGTVTTSATLSQIQINNLPPGVNNGASIIATATVAGSGSSIFSGVSPAALPFTVTTIADNGDNASPITGSLRFVLKNINQLGPSPVDFQIPASQGTMPAWCPPGLHHHAEHAPAGHHQIPFH